MSDVDVEIGEDTHAVGWDGEDDPKNPLNWPVWKKTCCVAMASLITFVT